MTRRWLMQKKTRRIYHKKNNRSLYYLHHKRRFFKRMFLKMAGTPAGRYLRNQFQRFPTLFLGGFAILLIAVVLIIITTGPKPEDSYPKFSVSSPRSFVVPNVDFKPSDKSRYVDFSAKSKLLDLPNVAEKYFADPFIYEQYLLFSAGSGSVDEPVLKKLYMVDLGTMKFKVLSQSMVVQGEIFNPQMSENWIVWQETNHSGTNTIFRMNRFDTDDVKILVENPYKKLKFILSGNLLAYISQEEDGEDGIYVMDIMTEEDLSLNSNLGKGTSYGLSQPSISGIEIVWAESAGQNGKSRLVIFTFPEISTTPEASPLLTALPSLAPKTSGVATQSPLSATPKKSVAPTQLAGQQTTPEPTEELSEDYKVYKPGMYIHAPINYKGVYAWIDKNKAPDSNLYISVDGQKPVLVQRNVFSYGVGDGFVAFAWREGIWVYYFESGKYLRLTAEGKTGLLPVVNENRVAWLDKSGDRDKLWYIDLPVNP